MCALITSIIILLTIITINAYQKINQRQQAEINKQHEELLNKNKKIETALREVKQLSGLLPICSSCKKIQNDEGSREQLEVYIRDRSEADFSHGICPDCAQKMYKEMNNGK